MNNEIKEILSKMERLIVYVQYNTYCDLEKQLLDYITNLQQKYEEADYDRHKLFEENERLKENNQAMQEEMARVWEENERLKEENKHIFANVNDDELLISNAMNYAELQDYKSRCEKAIEYINHAQNYGTMAQVMPHLKPYVNGDDLLNILQNGSDSQ